MKSPLGISIFSPATKLIRKADEQFSRLDWEYKGGQLAIDVDPTAVTVTASTIPGYDRMDSAACATAGNFVPNEDGSNTQECRTGNSVPGIIVGNISDENMAAIIKLQNDHVAIVNRLLDEIGRLQDEVLRLNTEPGKSMYYKHENKTYRIVSDGE